MAAKKKTPKKRVPKAQAPPPPELEGLNYRQRLFVLHYLGQANGSATEAARLAGYAQPHSQGPRLLEHVGVRTALDAKLSGPAMAADEVLSRLSDLAAVDLGDFITLTKTGKPTIDLRRAQAAGKLHLIRSLKPTKYGLSIELHDSQAALDKLARHHGLFKDRVEVDVTVVDAVSEMEDAGDRYEREHPSENQEGTGPGGDAEVSDGSGEVQ